MRKRVLLFPLLLLVLLVAISFSGCFRALHEPDSYSRGSRRLRYTITVDNSSGEEKLLQLPVPVYKDGTPSDWIDGLRVKDGSGTYKVTTSEKGPCIQVQFTDSIELYFFAEDEPRVIDAYWTFSMVDENHNFVQSNFGRFSGTGFYNYMENKGDGESISVDMHLEYIESFGSWESHWYNTSVEMSGVIPENGWGMNLTGSMIEDGTA